MEIVIKIQEKDYDDILNGETKASALNWSIFNAIRDGVALPKGHGKLIDADEVVAEATKGMKYPANNKYMECVIAHMKLASPIIDADTEDKEQEEERA